MVVWWIVAGASWTLAIWIAATFIGVKLLGARGAKQEPHAHTGTIDEAAGDSFIGYPTDFMFAVVDELPAAAAAIDELSTSGLDEGSVSSFSGESGAIRIDARGTGHGLFGRLVRISQAMSMDANQAARYENEALAGHTVIAVHGSDAATRERTRTILKAHGGHFINYYARLHFEALEP